MEIDNLKKAWQETVDTREKITEINYSLLKKMSLQITSNSINEIFKIQKKGTFLALIYATISFVFGFLLLKSYQYSIPLFTSGFLMIYSFLGHYKNNKMIENLDFYKTFVKDYLKTILLYQDWIQKSKKRDFLITLFWISVIIAFEIKYLFHKDVFEEIYSILFFLGVLSTAFLFISFGANSIFKDYDRKFNDIKHQLEEIQEFEKE